MRSPVLSRSFNWQCRQDKRRETAKANSSVVCHIAVVRLACKWQSDSAITMSTPLFRGASRLLRSVPRRSSYLQQSGAPFRRCLSSLNVESQQKVREGSTPVASESAPADKVAEQQLLASHLKEADPAMYEIIENASPLSSLTPVETSTESEGLTAPARTGEEETKALYQPHSLREFHISGRSGCLRESYAEYERPLYAARRETWLTHGLQTNTPKDILELGTMAATSSSINQRDYANREHSRLLVWTRTSGESMYNVRIPLLNSNP